MKKTTVRLIVGYVICIIICGLMTFAVTQTNHLAEAKTIADKYRILCDAFTIPGVTFMMIGALVKISDNGALDGLSYATRNIPRVLLPFLAPPDERFGDYVMRKREERKNKQSVRFIFITGVIFMIPAITFMILFYKVY